MLFNKKLVALRKINEVLTVNEAAYPGMCILDLSKTLIYDFHYNYTKKKISCKDKLFLQTLIIQYMKLKQIMCMKIFI